MAAEIIVVVEDEDARGRPGGAAIEGGGRQSADARADDDEVVTLLDRQPVEGETLAFARLRVRGLERARVLSAQSGERGRIAQRLRRDLRRRREAGGDGQGHAIEEVAARNRRHALAKSSSGRATICCYASTDRNRNHASAIVGPSASEAPGAMPIRPQARCARPRLRGAER